MCHFPSSAPYILFTQLRLTTSDGALVALYLTFIALSFAGSYIHVERFFEHWWIVAAGLALLGICAALLHSVPNTTDVLFYALAVATLIVASLGEHSYSASAVVSVGFAALAAVSATWAMKKPLSTM